jgi:GxxExxY protein
MKQPLLYKEEVYAIIGKCMEVHRILGHGFLEIVYKDAIELEFIWGDIPFKREVQFEVPYKSVILKHDYFADFTVYDKIILEAKSLDHIPDDHIARLINYLKVSQYRLGLLVNFGKKSFDFQRIIL